MRTLVGMSMIIAKASSMNVLKALYLPSRTKPALNQQDNFAKASKFSYTLAARDIALCGMKVYYLDEEREEESHMNALQGRCATDLSL